MCTFNVFFIFSLQNNHFLYRDSLIYRIFYVNLQFKEETNMALLSNFQHLLAGVDIDELLQNVSSLKEQLVSAKKELRSYSSLLKKKDEDLSSLQHLHESLSEDLTRERNKNSIQDEKINSLYQTIAELKGQNEILDGSLENVKVEKQKLANSNASLNGRNLVLSNKVKALESKISDLESIQSELLEKESEIATLKADNNSLESENRTIQGLLGEANGTIDKEKKENATLTDKLSELQSNFQALSDLLGSLRTKIEELTEDNQRIQENSSNIQGQLDDVISQNKELETQKDAIEKELTKKNIDNDSLILQINELKAEKDALSPYMYLIEEKKKQEALELSIRNKKKELSLQIESAQTLLFTIKHEEARKDLETSIESSQILIGSSDCTLEELEKSITYLQSATETAEGKDKKLLEEEKVLNKKTSLEGLIIEVKHFYDTITYEDIALKLKNVIDDSESYISEDSLALGILDEKYQLLKRALEDAKTEIAREEKMKSHEVKRSILEIFDTKDGNFIDAKLFFKRPEHELIRWRRIFEESILSGEHRFVCPNCRQDVKISGRKYHRGQVSYFSHLYDSDFCEIKTTTGLSKEQIEARKYGLVAESNRHKRLKALIHNALEDNESKRKGVTDVAEEKRVNSDLPYMNWRRPDVMAKYNNHNIVFELQLSTTFVSVVVQRDIFYRLNNYFIIWVFNFDDNKKYVDLTNLMCKDIYYANKRNVFIFDSDAQKASEEKEELVLKCNWLDPDNSWHYSDSKGNGDGILITLDELKFDEETAKPYYYDAETPWYESHPDSQKRIQENERSTKQMIEELHARASREAEEAIIKRDNTLKKMIENDGHVSPYKEGNKYGFKYNDVILVPAKYSSYSEFGDKGMYKVSFNRHHGLIDKFGNELFACDYLDFYRLTNGLIVAESTSGFYISGIGRISERSPHDVISIKQLTEDLSVITLNSSTLDVFIVNDELLFKKTGEVYSYYSVSGEQIRTHTYKKYHFTEDYSAVWLKDSVTEMWRLMELDGSEKGNNEYTDCTFDSRRTIARVTGKTDVYNLKGELIRSTDYDDVERFKFKNYSKVFRGILCGLVNEDFLEVLKVDYEEIDDLNNFIIAKQNGKWGLLDENGVVLSDYEYDQISFFHRWYSSSWSNCILVKKDNLEGLYDNQGHCILKALYESIKTEGDYLIVKRNDKYGLFNNEGRLLLENKYDEIRSLPNKVNFISRIDEKWYIFNVNDNYTLDISYDKVYQLDKEHLVVQSDGLCGLSNIHGELVVPVRYNSIEQFGIIESPAVTINNSSIFKCKLADKVGAYSITDNSFVIEPIYDDIKWWNQITFKVEKDSKWGLFEIGKGLFTQIKYSTISPYDETRIRVTIYDGSHYIEGHINPEGKEILSESKELSFGYVTNKFFGKWALFKDTKKIIPYEHDKAIEPITENLFKVYGEGKCGIKNSQNQYVIPLQYRDILTKEGVPFLIVKLIEYRREREYTRGRSYHMVDVEYNKYQLLKMDGTQTGIPLEFRGTYSEMSFGDSDIIWIDKHLLSLDKFVMTKDQYSSFSPLDEDGYLLVKADLPANKDKYGLLNPDMQQVIPCEYKSIEKWGNNLFLALKEIQEGHWYNVTFRKEYLLYKRDGRACSIGVVSSFEDMGDGRAKVMKFSNIGYVNQDGELITDSSEILEGGITVNRAFSYIEVKDENGNVLLPLSSNVSDIRNLVTGYYVVEKNGLQGVMDTKGDMLVNCEYDTIELWSEGIVVASQKSDFSYSHKLSCLHSLDGKTVSTYKYSKISSLKDGYADAERNGIVGKINDQGHEDYDMSEKLTTNLTRRRCFGKWDVVDLNGLQILPCEYDAIELFEERMLLTTVKSTNSSYGYMRSSRPEIHRLYQLNGEDVLSYGFNSITKCSNGFYIISDNSKEALYDHGFNVRIPFDKSLHNIREWSSDKFIAQMSAFSHGGYSQCYVIVDEKGDIISKNHYTRIGLLQDGKAEVEINHEVGYIDQNCNEIVEVITTKGKWSITKSFGKYALIKEGEPIFTHLLDAEFFSDSIVKIKKEKKIYSLFSIVSEEELDGKYKQIDEINNSVATAVNIQNLKGTIDAEGKECYDETIDLGESVVAKRKFSRYDVLVSEKVVLSDILNVSKWDTGKLRVQIDANKVQIFKINDSQYIGDCYDSISDLSDGKAQVVKNRLIGYIDSDGKECYDEAIDLGESVVAKRKFSRYDVLVNEKVVLSGILKVSKWDTGKLRVQIDANKVQIFNINDNQYIGDCYDSISDLSDGKAQVVKNRLIGHIDADANVVSDEEIIIESDIHKIKRFGLWYIYDNNNEQIIDGSFREIGTYKGRFIKFDGSDFRLLNQQTKSVVPVYGTYYKNCTNTLIYVVGGYFVRILKKILPLNGKTISEFIHENKVLKLTINYINFKKQAVYAKPYKEPSHKTVYSPVEIGRVVEGTIIKILPFGIRIRTLDGRKTLIHESRLQDLGYSNDSFNLSQTITIKKVGFDEEHNNDIWEIVHVGQNLSEP